MKKLLKGFLILAGFCGPLWAGQGVGGSLTVSSGTFKPIQGFNNNSGNFVQGVAVADSSYTVTAPVDPVTGLMVSLGTSTANGIGSLSAGTNNIGTVNGSTVAIAGPLAVTQSGAWTVNPGTGTYQILGTVSGSGSFNTTGSTVGVVGVGGTMAATQSGTWNIGTVTAVTAISNALPAGANNIGTVNGSTVGVVGVGGIYPSTQSGAWTVSPGTGTYPIQGTVTANAGTGNFSVNNSTLGVVGVGGLYPSSQVGAWTVNPGTGTYPIQGTVTVNQPIAIISSQTLNVAGSFSASTLSTGPVNSAVPTVANLIGAQGIAGNLSTFRVDASSYLYVNVAAGGAAGGTSSSFGSAFPSAGTAAGFTNGTSMQAAAVNTSSAVLVAQNGAWTVNPGTGTYQILGTVSGTGSFNTTGSTVGVVGVGGTYSVNGSTLSAVQNGTWNIGTVTTVSAVTAISNALPTGANNIGTVNGSTLAVVNGGADLREQGSVAAGVTAAGNPVQAGLIVSSNAFQTSRAEGQITYQAADSVGRTLAVLDCPRYLIGKSSITITSSTSEVPIISSGATGVYNDLMNVMVLNTSASAARVDFRSIANQAVEFALYIPAGDTRGMASPHVWPQSNPAASWTAQSSTSVSDIRIYTTYCRSKN